ncbi:zinc finger protein 423 [Caerostris darwini]|uniref:Zinc finger protein 423 n=1 Tax=Caerostris darwini TaxID=1538125 RepID=A0AAV4SW52_9ARAC|nr:zinc finger protein 423 [Caerostris darwini]
MTGTNVRLLDRYDWYQWLDSLIDMTGIGGSNCGGGSVRSSDTPDDVSLSPGECPTPTSGDSELSYTVGVTESTPYGCQFCDKAFPRLSYLKRHEQVSNTLVP